MDWKASSGQVMGGVGQKQGQKTGPWNYCQHLETRLSSSGPERVVTQAKSLQGPVAECYARKTPFKLPLRTFQAWTGCIPDQYTLRDSDKLEFSRVG